MRETMESYKQYWDYLKDGKGYKIVVRMLPFMIAIFAVVASLTIYAFISVGLNIAELESLSTINPQDTEAFISEVGINTLQALGTYILMIVFVIILLSVGFGNSCYQTFKAHIIDKKFPSISETFTNSLNGYFRFFGYLILYVYIPTIAIIMILYVTGLQQYSFISVFVGALIEYYFYSKLLRINGVDFLVPVVLGLVMVIVSYFLGLLTGPIGIVLSLINAILLGLIYDSIMIFSVLKTNDFKEGIRFE